MAGLYSPDTESAKIILMGDSGHGKTGAKAALVALGYKLRILDTDRGFKILRSLLTDPRYPYAAYMKRHGIDPGEPGRISHIPINVPIGINTVTIKRDGKNHSYDVISPTSAAAWSRVVNQLREWKDPDQDLNLGPITDWENDSVLDLDTISTLAELAKYWSQDMNNELGALDDPHGRHTGAAQELTSRLMIKLTSSEVRCNVIATTHITWADVQRGAALSPEALLREKKSVDARGFPSVIGRALSPVLGKRWNDVFIVRRTGSSADSERRIYSEPIDNTDAKHSVWLEKSYPLASGLGQIFYALQYKELPDDFISSIEGKKADGSAKTGSSGRGSSFGTF